MAMILSGKEVAEALDTHTHETAAKLREQGVEPTLAVIRIGENPSDLSYERGVLKKAERTGVEVRQLLLRADCGKEQLAEVIGSANRDDGIHGVLLFRPLPASLRADARELVNLLDPEKDVDGMTDLSCAGVFEGVDLGYAPCTPQAVMEIIRHYGIELKGKNVAVIGRSLVVGKPLAMMLMAQDATVTVCHTKTRDVKAITREADIVVTAAGVLRSLTADYVREGQTVIDVSINYDPAKNDGRGGIAGDAVFAEVEPAVGAITPVPGGVGSVTTSVLMEHVVRAAVRRGGAAV